MMIVRNGRLAKVRDGDERCDEERDDRKKEDVVEAQVVDQN